MYKNLSTIQLPLLCYKDTHRNKCLEMKTMQTNTQSEEKRGEKTPSQPKINKLNCKRKPSLHTYTFPLEGVARLFCIVIECLPNNYCIYVAYLQFILLRVPCWAHLYVFLNIKNISEFRWKPHMHRAYLKLFKILCIKTFACHMYYSVFFYYSEYFYTKCKVKFKNIVKHMVFWTLN